MKKQGETVKEDTGKTDEKRKIEMGGERGVGNPTEREGLLIPWWKFSATRRGGKKGDARERDLGVEKS